MSTTALGVPVGNLGSPSRAGDLAAAGLIAVLGVLFNVARLRLRLDQGTVGATLVAFAVFGAAAVAIARTRSLSREDLGLVMPLRLPAVVGGSMAALTLLGTALLSAPVLRVPNGAQLIEGILIFGVFTGPAEELMFRGVMFSLLERHLGAFAAVVLTSGAFAVIHIPVYGLVSLPLALVAGLLLGWLRWWSRSVGPAVLVHAAADLGLLWL